MNYEEIQNRKLISAYGGVGSIIETRHGAVMIDKFTDWPFFVTKEAQKSTNFINDERFKTRLRQYFTQLQELISLPENQLRQQFTPENHRNLISAKYFPKWMYCTSCHTFNHVDKWKEHWNNTVANNHKDHFNPPKCYKCYADPEKKGQFYDLEQVRFVMTSPTGNIADVPWNFWVFRNQAVLQNDDTEPGEEEDANQILLNLEEITIPENIEFKYITSARFGDLKGIRIEAFYHDNQGNPRRNSTTLAGIFNLRIFESQHPEIEYGKNRIQLKTVLRSSNSVYYPNISQSIYLPVESVINNSVCETIRTKHNRGRSSLSIQEDLEDNGFNLSIDLINSIIENNFQPLGNTASNEEQYRWEEYDFITSNDSFRENDLIFEKVSTELFDNEKIKNVIGIDRLKVITTQTSFTRQKPIDKDAFLREDLEGEIQRKFTSSFGIRAHYLPAYESFGEGIFMQLDRSHLIEWEQNEYIVARIASLQRNFNNSFLGQNSTREITPRFVLTHTLSHLIIKELEFLCGYPAASLQERLYISERMSGFLIYTVAGAEGSYGGLVSLCKTQQIGELIKSALHRAKDCASDPICYDTDQQGQGTAGLNLAACYSCALLPETSCEEFNSFLDRRVVIDENNGFFR